MTGRRERGGTTVEMVIIAPLLIIMVLFVVGLGRLASTREVIDGAARDGAREASMARNASDAVGRAQAVVQDTLQGRQVTCQNLHVNTDATSGTFQPGGTVMQPRMRTGREDPADVGVTFRTCFVTDKSCAFNHWRHHRRPV